MKPILPSLALACLLGLTPVSSMAGTPDPQLDVPTTVTGIVEDVDREQLVVTILTDSGRVLSFSAAGSDVIDNLHAGDRVQIQIVMEDEDAAASEGRKTEI